MNGNAVGSEEVLRAVEAWEREQDVRVLMLKRALCEMLRRRVEGLEGGQGEVGEGSEEAGVEKGVVREGKEEVVDQVERTLGGPYHRLGLEFGGWQGRIIRYFLIHLHGAAKAACSALPSSFEIIT